MEKADSTNVVVDIPATIQVKDFAERSGVKVSDVVAELMKNGVMATINDAIDFDTASIIASDLGIELKPETEEAVSGKKNSHQTDGESLVERPPVVAVMGHVDHGKTTLLDAIRKSEVAKSEAGGITQHVKAYQIIHSGRKITFLDTPGHEAFSILREHGTRLTDIALIVVAADEGVKPQTEEVISFAVKSGVRSVVAITKIDKPNANIERVKQQLSEKGLMPEEWGGDTVMVEVSAQNNTNLDKLLDVILLITDVDELKARADGLAEGTVVEAHVSTGQGPLATLLVEAGTLKKGDYLIAGSIYAKVRTMEESNGEQITEATSATPVLVAGWRGLPVLGEQFVAVESEKQAKAQSLAYAQKQKYAQNAEVKKISSEDKLTAAIASAKKIQLPLLLKADVHGSLQAVISSLETLGNEEIEVRIVDSGVGAVNESDVAMAGSTGASIIGFNVSMSGPIKQLAARSKVQTRFYKVIYELLDDIKAEMEDKLGSVTVEELQAELEVKGIFRTSKNMLICGGLVKSGKLSKNLLVREENAEQPFGSVKKLQREQQAVEEVKEGNLCGVEIVTEQKSTVQEGDKLIFVKISEKAKTL